ncbi:hypothetical protein TNCT_616961 [Trichonephila clavata]|uniref:Uncharacterized protein n=1 Tax=Trichonephila clavata TaxID=2740835 RepID=A0A8X6JVJ9_TRICU|nr:hypothetical protein TNCT_616961 [Trichonephila clavata]
MLLISHLIDPDSILVFEMDTSSNCPNDPSWQATFVGISIHLKHELHSLANVSMTYQEHAPKKLTTEAKFMM